MKKISTSASVGVFLIFLIGLKITGLITIQETSETTNVTATTNEITLDEATAITEILQNYKDEIIALGEGGPEKKYTDEDLNKIFRIINDPKILLNHEILSWLLLKMHSLPEESKKSLIEALCEAVPQLKICGGIITETTVEEDTVYGPETQIGDLYSAGVLSARAYNVLYSIKINTIGDLNQYLMTSKNPERKLMGVRNLGPNTAREILKFMKTQGYTY